jgi:hypothetical protein
MRRVYLKPWEKMLLTVVSAHVALACWIVMIAVAQGAAASMLEFVWAR